MWWRPTVLSRNTINQKRQTVEKKLLRLYEKPYKPVCMVHYFVTMCHFIILESRLFILIKNLTKYQRTFNGSLSVIYCKINKVICCQLDVYEQMYNEERLSSYLYFFKVITEITLTFTLWYTFQILKKYCCQNSSWL